MLRLSILLLLFNTYLYAQEASSLESAIDKLAANYQLYSKEETLEKIDSLLQQSRVDDRPNQEVRLLILREKVPSRQFQIDKVITDLDRRLVLARKHDTEDLATIFESKATFEARRGDIEATWRMLDSTELYLNDLPEREKIRTQAQVFSLKGRMLDRVGKLEEAIKMYQRCIDEAEKINYDLKIMDVYFQLGFVQKLMSNMDQSLKSYQKSLEYSLNLQDTNYMVYNRVFIAGNYNSVAWDQTGDQKAESLAISKRQLDLAQKLISDSKEAYVLELYYYEKAQYLAVSESYAAAIECIELCREQTRKTNNIETEIPTYYLASDCFFNMSQYQKALDEAVKGIVLAKEKATFNNLRNLYHSAARAAEELGNTKLALHYSKQFIAANDSIIEETMIKSINELQTKYETEKKEAEIESLTQKSAIQELQIQQRNQAIWMSVGVFILIAVLAYFIFLQSSNAKRRKQIELEQRFLRSQLNPHFVSNALVAVQSSLMEKDTESAATYLATFARLMREILENSREEFVSIDTEITMLNDYLEINKRRLDNRFTYHIEIDEDIDPELDEIPPMFIQPFVENAIEHGIPEGQEGEIIIKLKRENGLILATIKDNGGGLEQTVAITSDKRSLSTQIIKERIALMNESLKEKISLKVNNWSDDQGQTKGVMVALAIPLRAG